MRSNIYLLRMIFDHVNLVLQIVTAGNQDQQKVKYYALKQPDVVHQISLTIKRNIIFSL